MTKLDQIIEAAGKLSEAQLDGLLDYARYLSSEPFFERAPAEARASIERGLAERDAGLGSPAAEVFARLKQKIDSAGA